MSLPDSAAPPPSAPVETGAAGAALQPGGVLSRGLWLVAHSTLLLLLGLVLLAAVPAYAILSDGLARRWHDDYAIVSCALRFLNLPLALAVVVGVFYVLGRVAGVLLEVGGPQLRRRTATFFRFLVLVGVLEFFPWLAQKALPSEMARALLGMLLLLMGASSRFGPSPSSKKDVVFMIGLALAVEGIASLLWDSGWLWQGWGARLAKAAVVAAGVAVLRRWWRDKNGGFKSSAQILGSAVEETRSFALRVWASRGRPLGPPDHAQSDAPRTLDPLDLP